MKMSVIPHHNSSPLRAEIFKIFKNCQNSPRMAIPLDKIAFSFKGQLRLLPVPATGGSQNDQILPGRGNRECFKRAVLVKTNAIPESGPTFKISDIDVERKALPLPEEPKLAQVWRKVHGENDWEGMLDPIDPLLKATLMRYGDMAQACYDAIDDEPYSNYCGCCKFRPDMFFDSLGYKQCGYEISRYLFSTYDAKLGNYFQESLRQDSWSISANWIGYVAVSNDVYSSYLGRRDITIVWRGRLPNAQQISGQEEYSQNLTSYHKVPTRDQTIKVDENLFNIYTNKEKDCKFCEDSARKQVLKEVERLKEVYWREEISITITGHCLGGALATLNAYDIAEVGLDVRCDGRVIPVAVFSFSGSRVGNAQFKKRLEELDVKILRVFNIHDKVKEAPGINLTEKLPKVLLDFGGLSTLVYFQVGKELALDHKSSPYLKETSNQAYLHNLELLLHLIAGYHGKSLGFGSLLASERDIALVNKRTDTLKDKYLIPPNWWQTKNRGFVRDPQGRWVMPERKDYL